jgi:hypothetical protein
VFYSVRIRRLAVVGGWALGILAFAFTVSWVERGFGLSLGPSLGVGASVALIWVTSIYVASTKQIASDQAALFELQRKAPYRAGLVQVWELSVRSMRLAAEVKTSFQHGATTAKSFTDAFASLDDARMSADKLSLLASDYLSAAGSLDPMSSHGNLAADQSIALLTFSAGVMPSIAEATQLLTDRRSKGLSHQLPKVPESFMSTSRALDHAIESFSNAINDELGKA